MVERYQPETVSDSKPTRDRSPSFPFIPLQGAIERLVQFEDFFKRHPAPANKVGLAWKMKENSSQALQTVAALKAFGLLESKRGSGEISVSEGGRTYVRAQQESVRGEVLKRAALKPVLMSKYWELWDADRPPDAVCLDELVLRGGFTQAAAETFLKVYDATIGYAKLGGSDKVAEQPVDNGDDGEAQEPPAHPPVPPPPAGQAKARVTLMESERVVFTEESDPQTYVRLIASGIVDDSLLEALEDYVKRQRKRLAKGAAN
jgi:hypothetical protein